MCTGDHGRAWLRYKGGGSPFESSDFGRKGERGGGEGGPWVIYESISLLLLQLADLPEAQGEKRILRDIQKTRR